MKLRIMLLKDETDADDTQFMFADASGNTHTLNFTDCGHVVIEARDFPAVTTEAPGADQPDGADDINNTDQPQ